MSEDLHGRLASDLRMGTAQIMVNMKFFYEELKSPSREYQGAGAVVASVPIYALRRQARR